MGVVENYGENWVALAGTTTKEVQLEVAAGERGKSCAEHYLRGS